MPERPLSQSRCGTEIEDSFSVIRDNTLLDFWHHSATSPRRTQGTCGHRDPSYHPHQRLSDSAVST
jgi:hypothetical protein